MISANTRCPPAASRDLFAWPDYRQITSPAAPSFNTMKTPLRRLGLIWLLSFTPLFSQETKPDEIVHFRTFGATAAPDNLFYKWHIQESI